MRLTCPNCGAQYEVPDDVVPPEGRDVQCSNCGNTWFQAHPDDAPAPISAPAVAAPAPEPEPAPTPTPKEPATPAPAATPDVAPEETADAVPEAAHEDTPEITDKATDKAEDDPEDEAEIEIELLDDPDPARPAPVQQPVRQALDPSISDILRQEAAREAELRAQDSVPLETQPDLGLDDLPQDEAAQRAKQARDRMAKMRGEQPAPQDPGSRRDLLPDIEEINSSLRGADSPRTDTADLQDTPAPARGGFARGFALVIILTVILLVIYVNAPRLAQAVPQANPALNAYVALVDQGRAWLDGLLAR